MAKPTGFLDYSRQDPAKRPVEDRVRDYKEIEKPLTRAELEIQAARCMDCGIPSCHNFGCPVKNLIPDWNDMVYRQHWQKALRFLEATNNLPEVTGRICPAPCEASCTLSINQKPVSIRHIELQIVERGWAEGWIQPQVAPKKTGKKVAVVGSGPAGLAAAQQLARAGHEVVLFEKSSRIGGLLRYGIPDFKLDKGVLDRRMGQMQAEGVTFKTKVNVGVDVTAADLKKQFAAVVITAGAGEARDLKIPGRELKGIHFALDFLGQQNQRVAGEAVPEAAAINARDKHVVVIGGGDTGADCIGTSRRQGAASITQIELLCAPPAERAANNPWPTWPLVLRTSSSHDEGCERMWSVGSKRFTGEQGQVRALQAVKLDWSAGNACKEIEGSEFELKADLVFLAMGFVHVEHGPLVRDLNLKLDARGNILVDAEFMTSEKGVFAAGDAEMGASLVMRAIYRGRQAAEGVNRFLKV
ncbi:MAG: glutamate synthase subunit beta [Candidatus Firestonebacteria bacterium]|nr:glutamate synthase subunit beta [Candidatus Firestonebacteria bacterium]